MAIRPLKIKFLAAFVIAFVCLNAGGAVCVAYCQSYEIAAVESEHCPLKKPASEHCDKSVKESEDHASVNIQTGELDCCPMTISFFAAPVEKNSSSFLEIAVAAGGTNADLSVVANPTRPTFPNTVNYRGPPPRMRSPLRNRYFLLRI
jgi:hypothetical protein